MKQGLTKVLALLALLGAMGSASALESNTPAPPLASSGAAMHITRPASTPGLRSVLEPASPDYRFSITVPPKPSGWALLLGALLTGGFIVRRRLGQD